MVIVTSVSVEVGAVTVRVVSTAVEAVIVMVGASAERAAM